MPRPRTSTYRVRKGDSLWTISEYEYGEGKYWPEIATANRIPKPSLLLAGQILKMPEIGGSSPTIHHHRSHRVPVSPNAGLLRPIDNGKALARPLRYPAFKYDLEKLPPFVQEVPPVEYKLKLKGELTLQSKSTIPDVVLVRGGVETKYVELKRTEMVLKCKTETDTKLNQFFSTPKIKYNPKSRSVEVGYEFGVATKLQGGAFVSSKFTLLPNGFKYTYEVTDIKGEFNNFSFDGSFGYELEITQKASPRRTVPAYEPVTDPVPNDWIIIGFKAAAVALVVGTIVEDVVTLGAGTLDDPVSFAAAAAMWTEAGLVAP